MKKTTLFLACCIGLMLFASCKKDPVAPTINLLAEVGCVTEDAQVYSGDEILVAFTCTGENLTQIEVVISQNGIVLATQTDSFSDLKDDPVSPKTYKHAFTIEAIGTVNIKGTVTDANGLTASKSFDIFYNEKPCAKFLGHYEGDALFTGMMKAEIQGMDPMEQEVTDRAIPVILDLSEGATITEIIGTCKIDDQEMEIKGTVEGNTVTFDAANTTITFDYPVGGFSVSPEVNMTYNVKATLDGEQLSLDGTCVGNGDINLFIYNGTVAIDGTIGGSLNTIKY